MQHRRQHVVEVLRKTGFPAIAEAGLRVLPDPVEVEDVEKFLASFGITCGMFGRWLGSRRLRLSAPPLLLPPRRFSAIRDVRPGPPARPRMLAESRLPALVVACHGIFGATTIVLVLAAVVGAP